MSKHINVNPDHYKVAGRGRPGKGLVKPKARAGKSGGKKNGGMFSGGREKGFKMEVKGGRGRVLRIDPP